MKIRTHLWFLTGLALVAIVGTACGNASASGAANSSASGLPASATVTIPKADRFEPFLLEVAQGARVTFVNKDSDEHTVVAMPTDPLDFKLAVAPGKSATYTFTQPGIYGYYCDAHSSFDPSTGLVIANKAADAYPISMYGIILVGGATLPIQVGHAKVVMPSADWFEPLAISVKAGTQVTWSNLDSDAHTVVADPGSSEFRFVAPANGTVSYTFNKPGIYAYYCDAHATWNGELKRVQARTASDVYPAAMEGVVFVLP